MKSPPTPKSSSPLRNLRQYCSLCQTPKPLRSFAFPAFAADGAEHLVDTECQRRLWIAHPKGIENATGLTLYRRNPALTATGGNHG